MHDTKMHRVLLINNTLCDFDVTPSELSVQANPWCVFLLVLQLIILCINVFLNSTLFLSVARLKSSSRRPCHVLMLHQVILNLLIAGFCQCTVALKLLPWSLDTLIVISRLSTTAFTILRAASVWNIALLSRDRYMYIVNFSTYKRRATYQNMAFKVAAIWIFSSVIGYSPIPTLLKDSSPCWNVCLYSLALCPFSSSVSEIFYFIYIILCFILPCIVMVKMYCSIYTVTKEHRLRWASSRIFVINELQINSSLGNQQRLPRPRPLMGVKAARVLLFAMSTYTICFTPYFVSILMAVLRFWNPSEAPSFFQVFSHILLFSHTLLDPFLHGFGNSHIKPGLCWFTRDRSKRTNIQTFQVNPAPEPRSSVSQMSTGVSRNAEGSSLFSREDLVSRDFLEEYKATSANDPEAISRRPSWRYPRVIKAWGLPVLVHRKLSGRDGPFRSLALRTIGENAAMAIAVPSISSSSSEERKISDESSV